MEGMSMISKIYVSDWVITMNLWNVKGDSPVARLSKRHTRHYAIRNKERDREREIMQYMPGFHIFLNV
jgi:hypothetical protein